jgi:hypothetical protein
MPRLREDTPTELVVRRPGLGTIDLEPIFSEWATHLVPPSHAKTKPLLPAAIQPPLSAGRPSLVGAGSRLPRIEPVQRAAPPRAPGTPPSAPARPSAARRRVGPWLATAVVVIGGGCTVLLSSVAAIWLAWALR